MQNPFNKTVTEFLNFLRFGVGGGCEQREGFGARALTEEGQGGVVGCREKKGLEWRLGLWRGKRD